jgi:hypothetical protein
VRCNLGQVDGLADLQLLSKRGSDGRYIRLGAADALGEFLKPVANVKVRGVICVDAGLLASTCERDVRPFARRVPSNDEVCGVGCVSLGWEGVLNVRES